MPAAEGADYLKLPLLARIIQFGGESQSGRCARKLSFFLSRKVCIELALGARCVLRRGSDAGNFLKKLPRYVINLCVIYRR